MNAVLDLALQNLLSPMVLFFALGLLGAAAKTDLTIPEPVAKSLSLFLIMSIGFRGGAELSRGGLSARVGWLLLAAALLSFVIPLIAYLLLRASTSLRPVDAAAVAAHYGSTSVVTFATATQMLQSAALAFDGYVIAAPAVMDPPAIVSALLLASCTAAGKSQEPAGTLLREIAVNSSVVMLLGSFLIGWLTGAKGLTMIRPFIADPFQGVLCLFLLDMGLVAGRGLSEGARYLSLPLAAFGLYMPLVSSLLAAGASWLLGLPAGTAALFITLAASASYIVVPAAMRLALPEAKPAIYLTLSLGVTFPFNLTAGIPLYLGLAQWVAGR